MISPVSPAPAASFAPEAASDLAATAVAQERRRLAQMLHDDFCQTFTGIQLLFRVLERKVGALHPELGSELTELREMVHQGASDLHRLVHTLGAS